MRSLLFWEFTKLTRNKRFVGFLTAALIFNLFVLLGGLFFGSLPSDSSVRAAARDLDGLCLTDQQKKIHDFSKRANALAFLSGYGDFGLYSSLIDSESQLAEYIADWKAGALPKYASTLREEQSLLRLLELELVEVQNAQSLRQHALDEYTRLLKMSDIANDTSSQKYLLLQAQKYSVLKNVDIRWEPSLGIDKALHFFPTKGILLLLSALFVITAISVERKNSAWLILLGSPNGSIRIALVKWLAVGIIRFIVTFVMYGSNILILYILYGGPDFATPIQSIPFSALSPLALRCGEYVVLYIFLQFLSLYAIDSLFLFLSLFTNHITGCATLWSTALLISYALRFSSMSIIPSFLKYGNVIAAFQTDELLNQYQLFFPFGVPVSRLLFALLSMLCISLFCGITFVFFFRKKIIYDLQARSKRSHFSHCKQPQQIFFSLPGEWRKLYLSQKAVLLTCAYLIFVVLANANSLSPGPEENSYRSVMYPLTGKYSQESYQKLMELYEEIRPVCIRRWPAAVGAVLNGSGAAAAAAS